MSTLTVQASRRFGTLSPLRYPGGKSALAGLFADLIDAIGLTDATYVEPYAGGAGAGIALLRQGRVRQLVINDIDPAVHAFWSSATTNTDALLDRVNSVPLTLAEWHRQRDIYRAGTANTLDLGFAFFYLNRTNRSGVLNAGVIGGQAQTGTYKIAARRNRATLTERLRAIGDLADRIEVTDLDGRTTIQRYATDPKAFLYIDPPYVAAGPRLYLNAFERRDHQALAVAINSITAAHWLLTYDVAPLIEHLYRGHYLARLALNYSARYPGSADELLVASPQVAAALTSTMPPPAEEATATTDAGA